MGVGHDPQQRDVRAGVAADEHRVVLTSVVQRHDDAVGVLDDVVVRDDEAFVAIDDDAGADALARHRRGASGASGPSKKRRKNGSSSSGLRASAAEPTTAMLTTAGVTRSSSGAKVGVSPSLNGHAVARRAASTAIAMIIPVAISSRFRFMFDPPLVAQFRFFDSIRVAPIKSW